MKRWRLAAALLGLVVAVREARADDPAKIWRTIDTPHFHITYYVYRDGRGEQAVAERLAAIAEEAHTDLTRILGPGLSDKRKTWVLLTDDTDDYNGSATVQPYPAVRLFASSPDDRAELNDYDDWLRVLFVHEYTHILHLGTIGGLCATMVNAILGWGLGIAYAPNQTAPRFILEGLAVFEESERTSGGRLRNSVWDMYLRAATLEGRLLRIEQFTNSTVRFPYGNAPYLYGSAFMRYLAAHYGQAALRRFYEDYGSNCIPQALNRSLKRAIGHTWDELYHDFQVELGQHYRAQRDAIARRGITPTRVLTQPREALSRPAFTPDGHLVFADSDGYTRPVLRRVPVMGGPLKTELRVDGAGGVDLSRDGRTLVFHALEPWRTYYLYTDLYLRDRARGRTRRLTRGLRASNPALSPDGQSVAFEFNEGSSRGLGLLSLHSGQVQVLIPASGFEQVYTPTFSPDGQTVAFSWWRSGGYRDIWLLDLKSRALRQITHDRAIDMEPRYSPDGKYLYFVSDRTEIHNLYAYELATEKIYQVTNVVNGVFDPAISPDGKQVAFVGFRADGYDLEVAEIDPARFWEAALALLDRPEAPPVHAATPPPLSHRYNPFLTLYPFLFTPFAVPDGYGEILGLQLIGSDLVGHHAWSLSLGFGTGRTDDVNFSFNYAYTGLWPSFSFGVGHSLTKRSGMFINGINRSWDEDAWTVATGVGLPIWRRLVASSDLSLSYSVTFARNISPIPPPNPFDFVPLIPRPGRTAGLGLTWNYDDVRRYTFSVSPESGRDIGLELGIGLRALGSDFDVYALSWHWREYIPMPWKRPRWLRSHVLALGYTGGIAGGDVSQRTRFFLGGYPPQDLLRSLYDFSRPGAATLRGYPYASISGDQFHVLNVEYRFPIAWIERSPYTTFPLYFRRLHGKVFADYGGAFAKGFTTDGLKLGVGGELILEIQYFYYFAAALQLGYAYGVNAGGGNQVYFLLNNLF